jgi:hypothetical protein
MIRLGHGHCGDKTGQNEDLGLYFSSIQLNLDHFVVACRYDMHRIDPMFLLEYFRRKEDCKRD